MTKTRRIHHPSRWLLCWRAATPCKGVGKDIERAGNAIERAAK
jgi:hypothetical protein